MIQIETKHLPTFMNTKLTKNIPPFLNYSCLILIGIGMLITACTTKDNTPAPVPSYTQVNLVADTLGFGAARIDANLANAWGIAIGPTGAFWISANHTGTTVIYDNNGAQLLAPVNVPLGDSPHGASPTGVIFNSTSTFVIPGKGTSLFIYATEDGILSAWNQTTGSTTMTVADRSSAGAVYKGLAMANDGGASFIYVADFHNAAIDVFDGSFALVTTKPFNDPNMPAGFAPFNIQNIGGQLYVTYAKQLSPENKDDESGLGNGYVDIYTPAGMLVKRFASQGTLNSPWGIALVSAAFGEVAGDILIGNFGDGRINVYDMNGTAKGQLMANGVPVTIPGLWAITFDNVAPADPNQLYFTAGPDEESHGIFGYLKKM
jgi:uncharacterized protein (TIGR03118 family)